MVTQMKIVLFLVLLTQQFLFASFSGVLIDSNTTRPIQNAIISDSRHDVRSDANGSFFINSKESVLHIKAYGYRPYSFQTETNATRIYLRPIKVKALYLTFWGASNNSKTLKNILKLIDQTDANAVVVDVKNEYGSTQFWTGFKQANAYGAYKNRTNRDIKKFIKMMKERNIYTIARIVMNCRLPTIQIMQLKKMMKTELSGEIMTIWPGSIHLINAPMTILSASLKKLQKPAMMR